MPERRQRLLHDLPASMHPARCPQHGFPGTGHSFHLDPHSSGSTWQVWCYLESEHWEVLYCKNHWVAETVFTSLELRACWAYSKDDFRKRWKDGRHELLKEVVETRDALGIPPCPPTT